MVKTIFKIFMLIYFFSSNTISQVLKWWVAQYYRLGNSDDTPRTIVVDDSCDVHALDESFGDGNDLVFSITSDNYRNAYVTVWSDREETSYEFATIKYSTSEGSNTFLSLILNRVLKVYLL